MVVTMMVLVLAAADVACSESGRNYEDGACVLAVVTNRASSGWRRYDGTLMDALMEPAQHAHGCRWPITPQHVQLGVRFAAGTLEVPEFCRRALHYCGDYDPPETCHLRRGHEVGKLVHTYYGVPRRPGGGVRTSVRSTVPAHEPGG